MRAQRYARERHIRFEFLIPLPCRFSPIQPSPQPENAFPDSLMRKAALQSESGFDNPTFFLLESIQSKLQPYPDPTGGGWIASQDEASGSMRLQP